MTSSPRVGLMLATLADPETGSVDPARVLDAAQRAEAAGFDGVYVGDHLLHPHPILESIVTLAAVAATTERIVLGPCVLLVALRDPLGLAKQLATLAAFAPGRLRVGVGVGGDYPGEFEAAGVPVARRGRLLEERLATVRSVLSTGLEHGAESFAPTAPEVPFFFGGRSEGALARAARYGAGWIGYLLDPGGFARRRSVLLECRSDRGSADAPFSTGMLLPVHVGTAGEAKGSAAAAWARMTSSTAPLPDRLFVTGDSDEVIEQLVRYAEVGCSEFMLAPVEQGSGYLEQVDLLAADVLPQLHAIS
jgi:alkanesulfonate monooxygenase SsuD/methylene tetrahydromethanopterin reductase-like flavin-dependent oxidoreductase (luciferase family)